MNEFIIAFRECLEASLIVGIIYVFLDKRGQTREKKMLWFAVFSAVFASAVLGIVIHFTMAEASEQLEALLEAIFMYLTAGLLFYVIFWMGKNLTSKFAIQEKTEDTINRGKKWGVFFLVFFAILREGFETALFLVASTGIDQNFSYIGFVFGIILAILIGYLIVIQGKRIQLKPFFKYTSLLLVFFAAGMIAYGTHEFHEYLEEKEHQEKASSTMLSDDQVSDALVSAEIEEKENHAFSIFENKEESEVRSSFWYKKDGEKYVHLLNDKGRIGIFLKGLFGYNSDPIWIEVILWFLSLCFGLFIWRRAYK